MTDEKNSIQFICFRFIKTFRIWATDWCEKFKIGAFDWWKKKLTLSFWLMKIQNLRLRLIRNIQNISLFETYCILVSCFLQLKIKHRVQSKRASSIWIKCFQLFDFCILFVNLNSKWLLWRYACLRTLPTQCLGILVTNENLK